MNNGKLWLVALLMTITLAARATSGDKLGSNNDSSVVASSRKDVTVHLVLDGHHAVVSDSNKALWLVSVMNPRQYPAFDGSKEYAAFSDVVLCVEAVVCKNGQIFYALVPPTGYSWIVPVSFKPWNPPQI